MMQPNDPHEEQFEDKCCDVYMSDVCKIHRQHESFVLERSQALRISSAISNNIDDAISSRLHPMSIVEGAF
jgi:hypothetical protein